MRHGRKGVHAGNRTARALESPLHKGKTEGIMTLNVTTEPRADRQMALVIQVPQERVDQELRKAAAKVAREYRMPGFRKGKAPYHIVVQQFGLANLYGEFVDTLGDEVYKEALEQEQIEPYALASLEDVSMDPLVYKLVVPLEPVVELNDYRALRVEPPEVVLDDAKVDRQVDQYREEYASWQATEGPSAYGDMLTIDVKSIIAPAGAGEEPIVVLDETDWDVTPDQENPMDPPGFDEALIGMRPGETREFTLAWPAESRSIHAGKEGVFTVSLKQIQSYKKPELDDAFAAQVDPELESLEALRARVSANQKEEQSAANEEDYIALALDALVDQATLEYPPAVVEDQLDNILREYELQLRQVGIESLAGFLEQAGQDIDDLRASLREQAIVMAERNLVLSEIIRAEHLTVSDEEVAAQIEKMTQGDEDADAADAADALTALFAAPTGRSIVFNDLLRDKAVERVLAIARGEELPELPEPEAFDAEGAADDEAVEDEVAFAEIELTEDAPAPAESATEESAHEESAVE